MNKINKITLILRKYTLEETILIAQEANKYNCFNLEITTNTDDWDKIIKEVVSRRFENIVVGAGTVLNMDLLKTAIDAGSQFVLSPVTMSKEMIDYCKQRGVMSVPAAFSPSEIYQMHEFGADAIKLFPAIDLPSRYIKDISAPLGQLPIMVVGGVNIKNVNEYFENGAQYAGIGSGICNKEELKQGNYQSLVENLKRLSAIS
jgi:2-dehydro-3-deoxyphosphogluconate aldolase/(4S)-4-hydroxy-2-oxoglutarate aldolase